MNFNEFFKKMILESDDIKLDEYMFDSKEIAFMISNQEDALNDMLENDPNAKDKKYLVHRVFEKIAEMFYRAIKNELLLPKSKIQSINNDVYAKIIISNIYKTEMLEKLSKKIIEHFKDKLTYDEHLGQTFWDSSFTKFQTPEGEEENKFDKTFKSNPVVLKLAIYADTEHKILNIFFLLT